MRLTRMSRCDGRVRGERGEGGRWRERGEEREGGKRREEEWEKRLKISPQPCTYVFEFPPLPLPLPLSPLLKLRKGRE